MPLPFLEPARKKYTLGEEKPAKSSNGFERRYKKV